MKKMFFCFFILFFYGCFEKTKQWNGDYNQLPEAAKSCAISWSNEFYSVENFESEIKKIDFVPDKVIFLKSGSSGWGGYQSVLFLEKNDKLMTISSDYGSISPSVSDLYSSRMFSDVQNFFDVDSSIFFGDVRNLSNIPCDFVYYKSGKSVKKYAFIGLFDSDKKNKLVLLLERYFSKKEEVVFPFKQSLTVSKKMDFLQEKIKENIFFEIDFFDGS